MEGAVSAYLLSRSTVDGYAAGIDQAARLLADRLRTVRQPYSGATEEQLRAAVDEVDLDRPLADGDAALREAARLYLDHAVWFHEPRYVAHLNCPVALPALSAEVLISAVNSSLDTWDQSTAGTLIERRLIDWTAGRIGFGPDADGVFTSGGTQSNLQGLLLAREDRLARQAQDRVAALPSLRVLTSRNSHFSVAKSAVLLGLSPDTVVTVDTDRAGRLDPVDLRRRLDALERAELVPMAVVATVGTTDLGLVDPVGDIAAVCRPRGVWLHVDAAYGCGLLVSRRRRGLLDGIEQSDSVTVDFHKSFFQPVSSSAIVVRHADTLHRIAVHADYLNPRGSGLPNQVDKSLQTTRRFDALKLWLTLRTMGADQLGDLFDRVVDLAAHAHTLLVGEDDFEVAAIPTLSTVLFRWRPSWLDPEACDELLPRLRSRLFARGEAIVAGTRHAGRYWLKFTLLNPNTTVVDLREVIELVRAAGQDLLAGDLAVAQVR
ncbi:pyridoxal phosphate-dependent decarboxylase family protein [Catellatospora tritici]|uniref:pyridoxal phosphate-dependent decarboxylase family protein n=1 Tax=Catellatospora tritici TaxID=2851566 RepID=UPI001C2CF537|nr:aspartate aminotransferase family protein [Catellatospora tritici]MBV1853922.1 aspartate aminotransferase family protein [Catellatospora tritici]